MNLSYEQKHTLYTQGKLIVDPPIKEEGNWFEEWNHDDWISHIDKYGKWLHNNTAVQPYGYNVDKVLQGVQYIVQTVQDNAEQFISCVIFKDGASGNADVTKCELAGLYIAADEAVAIVDDYSRGYSQCTCVVGIDEVLGFVRRVENRDGQG